MDKKESFEEISRRFNENERTFICTEALRIFFQSDSAEVALSALELLERAAQPY